MKGLRILLVPVFFAAVTSFALAGTIPPGDPNVKTGGGGPSYPSASAAIITLDFSINSPSGTSPGTSPCGLIQGTITTISPACLFQNDITLNGVGLDITSLVFDALGIDPNTVSCGFLTGSPFLQCGVDPLMGNTGTEISFFDGLIPFGSDFSLDFVGFPQNFTFGTTANPTPDPGTLSLLVIGGLSALLARRRIAAGQSNK